MKQILEKTAILALSFGLVSTYSISSALPQMRLFYSGQSTDRVDLLVSVPSFAIMLVMLVNLFFSAYLKERFMIIAGLLLYSAAGLLPLAVSGYVPVVISRFAMGIGTGMVNSRAVSVISERYDGRERTAMLGYRGSVEAFGNAFLTMAAGLLLMTGWQHVYWIYGVGLVILVLYLAGTGILTGSGDRTVKRNDQRPDTKINRPRMTGAHLTLCLAGALLCFLLIGANTVVTMRIPILLDEKRIGTGTQAGMIISGMIIASVISGIFYSRIKGRLQKRFTPVMLVITVLGMTAVCHAGNLFMMGAAALVFGAAYPIVVTDVFGRVAESLPVGLVNRGTTWILIGCNLGAFTTTYIMKLTAVFSDATQAPVYVYAAMILAAVGISAI